MKVSKVKGHATLAMVDNGDARYEDLIGNNGADTAADLGRFRQQDGVIYCWTRSYPGQTSLVSYHAGTA